MARGRTNKIAKLFKPDQNPSQKFSRQGVEGFDNCRENIDPHVKTKVVTTKECVVNDYKLPLVDGTAGQVIRTDGSGVLTFETPGGGTTHDILSATHTDTLASAVSRGSIVYGNGTPKWAELTVGAAGTVLSSDGTDVSWAAAGAGDVTAALNLTDGTIVQGDGGAKGVKTSTATVTQISNNVTHSTGDGSDHADVATNTTHSSSDGKDHSDVVLNNTHRADNTQAHSDYLLNNAVDVGVGLTLTGDNSSADTAYVPMVLYNTDATPPAASGFPIGTLYVQYTA